MKKIRVGVLFGGKSAEHEISLLSAKNIIEAIDKDKYEVVPIGIAKTGEWLISDQAQKLLSHRDEKLLKLNQADGDDVSEVALVPTRDRAELTSLGSKQNVEQVDVIFPVLHGTYGEDGSIQGFLRMVNLPFVGPSVTASAVAMDKEIAKQILSANRIPNSKFLVLRRGDVPDLKLIANELRFPCFVKPANLGSSVGISRANNETELTAAIEEALSFDNKILIEEAIVGRELECAVLGNEDPEASLPGEVVLNTDDFYSYQVKYIDEKGAMTVIPADVPEEVVEQVKALAIKTFKAFSCEGMARVDMFLTQNGDLLINEVNTIPGFTNISMYPKLWEASGISYSELIDRLITLALERFERDQKLKTDY